jgi:hypothetical protein
MKVGMIFECGQRGADGKVYPCLAKKIRGDIEIIPFFLDTKKKLLAQCGLAARSLIEVHSCEKVVIIWDLRPSWEPNPNRVGKIKPCPVQDCQRIQTALESAQLTSQHRDRIHLVCIVQELETFLLVDESAICAYLLNITGRSCKVQGLKNPEQELNPKKRLYRIFEQNSCKPYDDMKDAEKIVKLIDINKLRRSKAFARFEKTIRLL